MKSLEINPLNIINLFWTEEQRQCNGTKTVSSIHGSGTTGHLNAKKKRRSESKHKSYALHKK